MDAETPFRIVLLVAAVVQTSVGFYYMRKARAGPTVIHRHGEGPVLTTLLVVSYAAYCVAVVLYLIEPAWMGWSAIGMSPLIRWIGGAVLLAGMVVMLWGLRELGTNLTFTIATKRDHSLVTSGPYRWVRHPLYSALFIESVGVVLLMANWFVAVTGGVLWASLAYRTGKEEQNLIAHFGKEYRQYISRTSRFFPLLSAPRRKNSQGNIP